MDNPSGLGRFFQKISDQVQDQVWFQQGKAKWDELDVRAKMAVKYALIIGSAVLIIGGVGTSLYAVAAQKREIEDKLGLIQKIQSAQEELKRLKDVTSRFNGGGDQAWGAFITERATPAGIDPSALQIVSEAVVASNSPAPAPAPKGPKSAKDKDKEKDATPAAAAGPEETVVEANIKKVNVRQLTKFLHEIENGGRTVKIRRLQVNTHPDESGFLDATVVVSAFRLKQ
jgi:hypothetical protein